MSIPIYHDYCHVCGMLKNVMAVTDDLLDGENVYWVCRMCINKYFNEVAEAHNEVKV